MKLNSLSPAEGSKPVAKRVGRGVGSGLGKTCGRGHKGQKSRSGGFHKVGFEGGQMPLQRRLPKVGFRSRKSLVRDQILLSELNRLDTDQVDLASLRAAGLISTKIQHVKVVNTGEITKAVKLVGIKVTKSARQAIEAAGGSVQD